MDYKSKTKAELLLLCKEKKIKKYSGKDKEVLCTMLQDYENKENKEKSAPILNEASLTYPKPFLKWVGGKTQILTTVLSLFPSECNHYYEPFLGGGSVLFAVLHAQRSGTFRIHGSINASDVNPTLIGLYKNIQSSPHIVITELTKVIEQYEIAKKGSVINRKPITVEESLTSSESYYYYIRSLYNAIPSNEKTSCIASSMFLFLNKTCFRGVYREGPNGFNVPYGHYNNPSIIDVEHIQLLSQLLQPVQFTCCSFVDVLPRMEKGDFTYLDPPYAPEQATSFVGYNKDGFGEELHTQLFSMCHRAKEKSATFLMSNADVKMVKDAFQQPMYHTTILSCRRAIHSKEPDARTNEVLIQG